ncbi:CAAX prenyl protease 2 [Stomoxys calcitrans]|uniref:CAAX prenyl protease 2 n=1 Tax=Stomoxys calcitrans TaxID=35570 RepID=UPI0027E34008|nr:CAAX prenyl protease 2 [Stomoxys calcitrans]
MNETNETGMEPNYIFDDVPQVSPLITVSCCLAMSILYLSSLYIWNNKHNRDHPATVKRRFLSVTVVMLITPVFVYTFSSQELLDKVPFCNLLGLRWQGLLLAIVIPYLLTVLLFLGPLCVELQNDSIKLFMDIDFWKSSFRNILWIRNHIMAPLSEEFVFRACMMPLILQSFRPITAVFITPLFFGVAHVHHIVERLSMGMEFKTALLISISQMTFTTLFGFYSAYLFARTGHFVAPVLVHAFCNLMGLPDVQELWQQQLWKRILLIICYILGFVAWVFVLPLATQPSLYQNNIFWPY